MKEFVRIILAEGDNSWIEYLIPVVFVIVYALSGIVKAVSNKQQDKGGGAAKKPIEPSRGRPGGVQGRPGVRGRSERTIKRERSGATQRDERGAVGSRKQGVLEILVESAMAKASAPKVPSRPQGKRQTKVGGGKAAVKPVAVAKRKPAEKKAKPALKAPGAFASLSHLGERDNLRMAIVYAEILGKPVGLRDM